MWINVYFPTDSQTEDFDDSELMEVFKAVTRVFEKTDCTDIVLNGDLNWDPSRNTGFSVSVKNFLESLNLVSVWKFYDVDYTHIHTDLRSTSVLDHFLVTEMTKKGICPY